jgi:hypothetical protein
MVQSGQIKTVLSARELAEKAALGRPGVEYGYSANGLYVAARVNGSWECVAAIGIDNTWYAVEHRLVIDGERALGSGDEQDYISVGK